MSGVFGALIQTTRINDVSTVVHRATKTTTLKAKMGGLGMGIVWFTLHLNVSGWNWYYDPVLRSWNSGVNLERLV